MTPHRRSHARLQLLRGSNAKTVTPAEALGPVAEPIDLDLDALYRRHSGYVAAVAVRLLGRDGEIDDLVQDVFLEAIRGIARLREPGAVRGWLAKVTVRMCMRRLRKRSVLRALHLEIDHDGYQELAGARATPEQRALIAKVYRVLDQLPARTRVIWILRHVLDEPLQSIVELTACSQSTVQRKLRDAEHLLDKELHDE